MRLFPPDLSIGDDEGFTSDKDIFRRKAIGDGLTNLISLVSDPLVLALDAPWGSGKTVFLKMWAGELRKIGVPVIYFDAFANDFATDAFTALAGQVKPAGHFNPTPITAGLVVLKTIDPPLYMALRTPGSVTCAQVLEALRLLPESDSRNSSWQIKWWRYCLDPAMPPEDAAEITKSLFQFNMGDRSDILPYVYRNLLDRLVPVR